MQTEIVFFVVKHIPIIFVVFTMPKKKSLEDANGVMHFGNKTKVKKKIQK